ncbi:S8 family serine peptidase [Glycomyces luteolus]|uniref:S8 family serine peptidase n=2 Tax=Glycomyces TaxID=58113 RepID=A0A9X3PBT4_9ACTN|nr:MULTISPECIES: S8 family serine peptidase [Glycomyces]MDA1362508.1 S8 family serine peptidase [Glycomyces luteolus]MDN3239155.1 S8 family serine peptidase [Glycomyces tritici]
MAATSLTVFAYTATADPALSTSPTSFKDGRYIVQFVDEPVAVYDGGVAGLEATTPDDGERIAFDSDAVQDYRAHLEDARDEILADVPGVEPAVEYDTAFNGFAAELTAEEAAELAGDERVAAIVPDGLSKPQLDTSSEFLGLSGEDGSWESEFGGGERAGEGVVIGIVDGGFTPENPMFAPLPEPRPDQDVIDAKWKGECEEGEDTPENNVVCSNKVIGARWFDSQGHSDVAGYKSPREEYNHGTHVATTAAGNLDTEAVIEGAPVGLASGMAPAARLAIYKVCWIAIDGFCPNSDIVAAIDAAVSDGVDVINMSLGDAGDTIVDPISMASFAAAEAGVFIANSAGNSGEAGASTVGHNSPWVTSVAAGSHSRTFAAELTLGDGQTFPYAASAPRFTETEADLVLAQEIAVEGADPVEARLCAPGTLDAAKVAGRAVACARGTYLFVEKAEVVADAGGAFALVYTDDAAQVDDLETGWDTPLWTVRTTLAAGDAIEAYAAGNDAATMTAHAFEAVTQTAPVSADFSSQGPAIVGGGDLLKPDITAPGDEILAGYLPTSTPDGGNFGIMGGTSMASPHIAGLAALIKSANPDWSPMAIKSAIMTTAYQTDTEGEPIGREGTDAAATPFQIGAGHVDGQSMFDPGLVYDSDATDWILYGCAIGQFQEVAPADTCESAEAEHGAVDPSDLNYPSIAVGDLTGEQKIARTVTNVDDAIGVYYPTVEVPPGFKVKVDSKLLVVPPGATATYSVTVTRTDAATAEWSFGALTWSDLQGHEVRSPITVRAVDIAVPSEITGEGADGSAELDVKAGIDGTIDLAPSGLVASETRTLALSNPDRSAFPMDEPVERDQTESFELTVPDDAAMGSVATFDADQGSEVDLDLYVYEKLDDGSLELFGTPQLSGSDEHVDLEAGRTYMIFVDLWDAPTSAVEALVHTWVVPESAAGNLTVAPESLEAEAGGRHTVTAIWQGLDANRRYLGTIDYLVEGALLGRTIVAVN